MAFTVRNVFGVALLVGLMTLAGTALAYEGDGLVEQGEREAEELRRALSFHRSTGESRLSS